MSTSPDNRPSRNNNRRPPLPARRPEAVRPPNFIEQARNQPASRARPRLPASGVVARPQTPATRRPELTGDETQRAPAQPAPPPARKQPTNIAELVPHIVRFALKRDEGLGISEFDEKLLPRVRALVPAEAAPREAEVVQEYLLEVAHSLYVAIVVGQFAKRPVLCGVRAAELAADLVERVLQQIHKDPQRRLLAIRCANLLSGLTLHSVRFLEATSLVSQPMRGFTDSYERAVMTTFGLKTQAESAGHAPWTAPKAAPLDRRISSAINVMSNVFGDYIGQHGESMDERQHEDVVQEFDGFMERFAPYIEGGRAASGERRRRMAKHTTAASPAGPSIEPLDVRAVRARPAGVEIELADGRMLFTSRDDARRIGEAADAEVEDTAKRELEALLARQKAAGRKG